MNTALKTDVVKGKSDKSLEIRPTYLEALTLVERLHRRLLDVIKDEFDRRGRSDVNSVQALLLYNIGDRELTAGELRTRGFWKESRPEPDLLALLDDVALGTVADVVPLVGLNRAFVAKGLIALRRRERIGVVLQQSQMWPNLTVRETHRAFAGMYARPRDVGEVIRLVGLEDKARRLPRELTQVEMRKLELARAMAAEPKLLIADESMAGLTHSEVEEILALLMRLNGQGVTIILIEHIMSAVMSFSQRLAVLVSGRKIADGKPDEVVNNPEVIGAYLGQ